MRFSKVKEKHIYNVMFDPVRQCEFNLTHPAVVLKKNNDSKTCVVMPLTTEPNGVGENKIDIGCISTLPSSLRGNNTYAVFNQVRTVNVNRFIAFKEVIDGQNTPIDCSMDDFTFGILLQKALSDLTFAYTIDEKMDLYQKLYNEEKLNKCISIAYNIKRLDAEFEAMNSQRILLNNELGQLLDNFDYELSQTELENGIQQVFENARKSVDS